jgi:ABC-2 type transport system permease protein
VRFLRLLAVFLRIGALGEMAYRANFWVQTFESVLAMGTALGAVAVVFSRTDTLGGWHAEELVALVAVYFLVLGCINVVIAPSFQKFMQDVRDGNLDFTLTKPADAQLLVSIQSVRIFKLLEVVLGVVLLVIALTLHAERADLFTSLRFAVALLCGGAIVYSFWLILATLAFWFIRIENILMIFWSMYTAGRWPVGLYPPWLKWLLTAVVPVAFAVTVPAEAVAGRLAMNTLFTAILLAFVFVLASRWFWKQGLKHYAGASA